MIQMPEWLGITLAIMGAGFVCAFLCAFGELCRERDLRIMWQQKADRLASEQKALQQALNMEIGG